jgi:hypothetical protein
VRLLSGQRVARAWKPSRVPNASWWDGSQGELSWEKARPASQGAEQRSWAGCHGPYKVRGREPTADMLPNDEAPSLRGDVDAGREHW